jgi:hypothetical protein
LPHPSGRGWEKSPGDFMDNSNEKGLYEGNPEVWKMSYRLKGIKRLGKL